MTIDTSAFGSTLVAQLRQLAAFSESPEGLTRSYLTPVHRAAGEQLVQWMQQAGMQARFDPVGNVVGRYEGEQPGLPALLIGSHFDSVRNAGIYDGALGVVAAIACVRALHDAGERLPFALEVLAFADEEGVRFGVTLIGSRAIAGTLNPALLEATDMHGMTMAAALTDYGLDPGAIGAASKTADEVLGFVELHIEQGPVLLNEQLALGVVTAIAGATRFQVQVLGQAGHAGTVPMQLRHDAAAAAAEAMVFIESSCRQRDIVGTVGQLKVPDGAVNVIPGKAEFSLDLRAGDDAAREAAVAALSNELAAIGRRRGVEFILDKTHEAKACACAPWLMQQLEAALERGGAAKRLLASGAGHDAMAMAALTDVAMLFVRCGNGGISHHPDETMTAADADLATRVLLDFIRHFRPRPG